MISAERAAEVRREAEVHAERLGLEIIGTQRHATQGTLFLVRYLGCGHDGGAHQPGNLKRSKTGSDRARCVGSPKPLSWPRR